MSQEEIEVIVLRVMLLIPERPELQEEVRRWLLELWRKAGDGKARRKQT